MKPVIIFLTYLLLITSVSCNTTEPTEDNTPAGSRNYEWIVDTLETIEGFMSLNRIWGSSDNDIWAVGQAYRNADCIWHYDGEKWKNYDPEIFVSPSAIYGFSSNNIWISSTDGWMWHYDGTSWKQKLKLKFDDYDEIIIESLYGKSYRDIYAVGYAKESKSDSNIAIIIHYDGEEWKVKRIQKTDAVLTNLVYQSYSDLYFISAFSYWASENTDRIYLFDKIDLTKIYSGNKLCNINMISGQVYINIDYQIYTYDSQLRLLPKINGQAGRLWGRSTKDIFIERMDKIDHYNGSDIVTMIEKKSPYLSITCAAVYEKSVVFIFSDGLSGLTILYHGKLKEE